MSTYQDAILSFDVPSDWTDKTLVSFSAPSSSLPMAASVVMTKDRLAPPVGDLSTYADHQLVLVARQLEGLDLENRKTTTIGGREAIVLRFSWRGPAGPVSQSLFMIRDGQLVISIATTCMKSEAEAQAPLLSQIMSTIRFTQPV